MNIKLLWERLQLKAYKRLSTLWLTKHIVWNIRTRYSFLKPASEKEIILGTMQIFNMCFLAVSFLAVCTISLRGASVYTYIIWFSLFL